MQDDFVKAVLIGGDYHGESLNISPDKDQIIMTPKGKHIDPQDKNDLLYLKREGLLPNGRTWIYLVESSITETDAKILVERYIKEYKDSISRFLDSIPDFVKLANDQQTILSAPDKKEL